MKKVKKRLLAWSIGSGLLLSSTLYSGVSLAYVNRLNVNNASDSRESSGGDLRNRNQTLLTPLDTQQGSINALRLKELKGELEIKSEKDLLNDLVSAYKPNLSALYISDNGSLKAENIRIAKGGDSGSLLQSNTNGLNSGVLIKNGDAVIVKSAIKTSGLASKGVYMSGEKSKALLSGVIAETEGDDSTGIEVADKGVLRLKNIAVNTRGQRSFGLASSNKGTLIANKGYVYTIGETSPGFYSAGNMIVDGIDIEAKESLLGIVEGDNNVAMSNVSLKGNKGIQILNHLKENKGKAIVSIKGGYIDIKHGPLFDIKDSSAVIKIEMAEMRNKEEVLVDMKSLGDNTLEINARNQHLSGDILNDVNSYIKMSLNNGSIYEGKIQDGASLVFDRTSQWHVKGDSHIGSLEIPDMDEGVLSRYVKTNGNAVFYEVEKNSWLEGKVIEFKDGGRLIPV